MMDRLSHFSRLSFSFIRSTRIARNTLRTSNSILWTETGVHNVNTRCSVCHFLQNSFIHTSPSVNAAKQKNAKRKIVKAIKVKKKGIASSQPVVDIHHNMTVEQLAATLDRDIDIIYEAMLFIQNTDRYDSPKAVISDLQVIKEICRKCGYRFRIQEVKKHMEKANKDAVRRPPPTEDVLQKRPPVVTIMGHVDHGKTTLLDTLRHSHIVDQEHGGITQHIGAFSVTLDSGENITFLDTPGHAAFHAMRSRGAAVTDIVVLVVAADDGVMKQTVESIQHAQTAGDTLIIAINKVDKPQADVERTKQDLLRHGLQLEDMGGDIQAIPVSALKGLNMDLLQEAIVAQAELMEVRGDPTGLVEAAVIEASTHPGRGKLATVLVQRGTLRKACVLVAGMGWAKVRGMFNDKGRPVTEARPGTAVEVIGWRELPSAGDEILEVESETRAREVMSWRLEQEKIRRALEDQVVIDQKAELHRQDYEARRQDQLSRGYRRGSIYRRERVKETIETHSGPELPIVLKGDVDGTVEAMLDALDTYDSPQCRLHLLHYGVGDVTEHDIDTAASFNGIVYGFSVQASRNVTQSAHSRGVDVRLHNVIYKLFEDMKDELTMRLPALDVKEVQGEASVKQIFMVTEGKSKVAVAGCRCTKGTLNRKQHFQLIRGEDVLIDGDLASLKHFKNEVESVKTDVECGLIFDDKSVQPQAGDKIICYELVQQTQEIDWHLEF